MIEKKESKNALIKFNVTKNEIFQLNENYKTVHRKLKLQYNVELWVLLHCPTKQSGIFNLSKIMNVSETTVKSAAKCWVKQNSSSLLELTTNLLKMNLSIWRYVKMQLS